MESDAPSSKVLDESASGRLCAVNCDVRRTNKHVESLWAGRCERSIRRGPSVASRLQETRCYVVT